ncbi:IDEAL domain-containing protein [Priestia sp. YIM B13484]|uniref:IDEAL domain-containing protein n=1 Tax=Priestia sp. YIM B13484 TaxID=3366303 RepID=UPI00366E48F5
MENHVSGDIQQPEVEMSDSTKAQLILNKSLHDFKKKQILEKIDQTLQNRDKEAFLRLTEKLKSVS